LPGEETGFKIPAPESGKRRPQMNLHDLFRFSAFSRPAGRWGFFGGLPCASRPSASDAHARFASIPAAPTIFCLRWQKMVNEAARLHFTRRQPLFTQKAEPFLHIFTFPEKPCL